MIPKKIHYFWFGGNEKPKSVVKCINSWKKYCPDYEIIEWNETNFDVHCMPFVEQAYEAKKYAFVSDVARLIVVYEQGGIYMDTDVEVLKPLDYLLDNYAYMSFENDENVNTGQGFGAQAGFPLLKEHVDVYKNTSFIMENGSLNQTACTKYTTDLLVKRGLIQNGEKQIIDNLMLYPADYFNPYDSLTGKLKKTENTYSIHWYDASWSDTSQSRLKINRFIRRIIGVENMERMKKLLGK